jgi:CheY-like chemotaxis protein
LLDNAVKFTETGSVTLHLQDEQAPSDQGHAQSVCHCRFTVTDTGSGIAADKLDLIFQPFEQVDIAQGPAIGTGLGLAISRRLVELMGGHLTVVSQLGVGSTFGFDLHLPIHSGPANVVTPRQVIGVKGPAPTVLIVDDNQYNRALLVDFLVPLGFPVLEAADGDAAMQVMYAQQPSIVLVDLVMPVMDGFAFIRDVRADRALAHLVLIAVSASVVGDEAQTSLQIGSNAFLRKPIEFAHLIKVLEQQAHIEWIEAPDRPLLSTATAPTQAPLSAHLSAEQRAVLLAAAQKGDIVALRTAVEQLVQSNSVALQHEGAALQALVETFQIQKVVQRLTS